MDWFQTEKGVCWGCILSPCLFNLYAEFIMWNAGQDEAQIGTKIAARNTSYLRYADVKVKLKLLSCVQLFATPWIVACTKLLHPWDFQGKSTGVGCHCLLQGIFPTQGSNPGLSHCRQMLYRLSHQGSPCRRHHPYGRKWKELGPLDEIGKWNNWLKTQHSNKQRSWHLVPSFYGK